MTRTQAITALRMAGYHDDRDAFTKIYIDNRIPFKSATIAFNAGKRLRVDGVRCGCNICAPKSSK